jgi:DNA-directed RNA polymerase subunit K/omega
MADQDIHLSDEEDYNSENEDIPEQEVTAAIDSGSDSEAESDSGSEDEDQIMIEPEDDNHAIETIVKDSDRITSEVLSKYEMIELINIRATQISKGDKPFTDVSGLRDPISMAKKEIYDNRCPLLIKRYIGVGLYEVWNPNEMNKPKI